VQVEADLVAIERDRAVDVAHGQDDDFEGPVHAGMMPAWARRREGPYRATFAAPAVFPLAGTIHAYPAAPEEAVQLMTTTEGRSLDARIQRLALAAGLTTVVFWASAFVGIRAAAVELSPGALALGRLLVGSLALGVVVLLRRPVRPTRATIVPILVSGVLWFGVYNVALNAAEREVDAG